MEIANFSIMIPGGLETDWSSRTLNHTGIPTDTMLQHIQKKTTHYHIHIFLINAIGKVFSEYIFSSLCSPTQYSKVICRLGGVGS